MTFFIVFTMVFVTSVLKVDLRQPMAGGAGAPQKGPGPPGSKVWQIYYQKSSFLSTPRQPCKIEKSRSWEANCWKAWSLTRPGSRAQGSSRKLHPRRPYALFITIIMIWIASCWVVDMLYYIQKTYKKQFLRAPRSGYIYIERERCVWYMYVHK